MKIKGVKGEHNELIHTARYIKSIVYGGMDGIITTFAIVAGVAGASLASSIVLILGFANLIADGISMATGDYLSNKSEVEASKNKNIFKKVSSGKRLFRISPLKSGVVTFFSFVVFGFVPLLAYVLRFDNAFQISIVLTFIALFLLGASKCKITNKGWFISGIETLVIGGVAAGASYYIGYLISGFV
jgi:predicted membrane protein (TIGR00267 family)